MKKMGNNTRIPNMASILSYDFSLKSYKGKTLKIQGFLQKSSNYPEIEGEVGGGGGTSLSSSTHMGHQLPVHSLAHQRQ